MKKHIGFFHFIKTDRNMFNTKISYIPVSRHQILVNLSKSMAYDIICYLLTTSFNLNIVGYNKTANEFYGKKTKQGSCWLQLNFKIVEDTNTTTNVIITPVVGSIRDIDKFIEIFNKRIYTYK
jgi:hypothetical protein